jgi:hypothetical protein
MTNSAEITLARAEQYVFSLGVPDLATDLCRANTALGLAKIHWAQAQMGREPDALFLGGPDMTVTRNLARWEMGFAYGGKVDWRGPGEPMTVLQVKPNVCGMLVAAVEQVPEPAALRRRVTDLRQNPGYVEDLKLEFDLDRSNHFVNLFTAPSKCGIPPHVVVLHGAAPELRDDNPYGWGLYWDRSAALRRAARHFPTPWGPLDVLVGEAAEIYWRVHRQAERFAAARRVHFAERLFGPVQVISNDLHQGLTSPGEMYLGCHPVTDPAALLPFMVRRDEPGYLLHGREHVGRAVLERAGLRERARALGVLDRLEEASLLPHGSGYAVAGAGEVVREDKGAASRVLLRRAGEETGNPREMVTGYRGEEVLERTLELGLGEIACRLEDPRTVVAP